ncbi:MAG: dihydroorotase [Clostridiales bacterium]|nr:MAG: dihydroorotase [Clostridiales bacterium]
MSRMVLKNGLVIDPSQNLKQIADIRIENGLVAEIGTGLHGEQELDLTGLAVFPGLVDMHVHFRDPGLTYKEDIFSGCRAAAAGGVTSVACMPNTRPTVDTPETVRYIVDKASHADAHVYPVAAITKGLSGVEMTDFAALKAAGAVGVSDDGRPVENAAMMQRALELADRSQMKIISHCEDLAIIDGGIVNEGKISRALGVKGMHRSSEDSVTAREIALAAATGTAIHIAHVSTKGSVALIRDAKARGVRVTAETAPHYFMLTDELLFKRDADYRMNPPLREQEDCDAVLEGVLDGTLDCIVTDHAPHAPEEKADFEKAPNGVVGLETSFAACMTALVQTGKLSISGLIERMSLNPARLLGIRAGSLAVGMPADIAAADLNERWAVDVDRLHSKSRNSVFKGMTLQGKIKYTLLNGRLVYKDNGLERKADAE